MTCTEMVEFECYGATEERYHAGVKRKGDRSWGRRRSSKRNERSTMYMKEKEKNNDAIYLVCKSTRLSSGSNIRIRYRDGYKDVNIGIYQYYNHKDVNIGVYIILH